MSGMQLRAFISSRMDELGPERVEIHSALAALDVAPFAFEADAGARPDSIRGTYLAETEAADLYIGVFWKGYGPHTIAEFDHAQMLGMDCLVYEKRANLGSDRDPELQAFLDRISDVETGLTVRRFHTAGELGRSVREDVDRWRAGFARAAPERSGPGIFEGIPARAPEHFVGRGQEIQRIARRLRDGQDVAIDGLPGIGKTSLALVLAHHAGIRRHFADGILWASLGPHGSVASALAAWGGALGHAGLIREDVARLPDLAARAAAIREGIGERQMLLVIDDVWEPDAASALRCGGTRCSHLVTTRDKGIARRFAGAAYHQALTTLDEQTAFCLLHEIAPEACDADTDGTARLVGAVGGLPQAIRTIGGYLATPSTGMFADVFPGLAADALADMGDPRKRLEQPAERFGAFQGGTITLQQTVALSLDALPDPARQAFYRLGAFASKPMTFTADAARAVTQSDAGSLALLAARNLLDVDRDSHELALHPTLADVASTKLDDASVARHREHYLSFAREHLSDWKMLDAVYGQVRWAWEQAPDDETLFPFLGILELYQVRRGLTGDTLAWAGRALAAAEQRKIPPAVAALLTMIGKAHAQVGYREKAIEDFRRAGALWEELDDQDRQLETRTLIALALARLGRSEHALEQLEAARALAAESGNPQREADCLLVKAYVYRNDGVPDRAILPAEQALTLLRKLNNEIGETDALGILGTIYRDLDQPDRAMEYIRRAKEISESLGQVETQTEMQIALASVYDGQERLDQARAAAEAALRTAEASGNTRLVVQSLDQLGDVHMRLGQTEAALACIERRLRLEKEVGNRDGQATIHRELGWILWKQGDHSRALDHYHDALSLYSAVDNRAGKAETLERMHLVFGSLDQLDRQRDCLEQALTIWQTLENPKRVATVLRHLGDVQCFLESPEAALTTYERAARLFDSAEDPRGKARVLGSIAYAYDLDEQTEELDGLKRAIDALEEAVQLDPTDDDFRQRLRALETRRGHARRFGARIVRRNPGVTAVKVETGRLAEPLDPERGLRPRIDAICQQIASTLGMPPPRIHLRPNPSRLGGREYLIVINDVPLVGGGVPDGLVLFPGPPDALAPLGVEGEPTTDPTCGRSAAWVAEPLRRRVEGAGHAVWDFFDYIERHLDAVLRANLWQFVGHQETIDLLDRTMPEAAERFRDHPADHAALVAVLKTLVEEQAPIVALRRIVDTFTHLRAGGANRLDMVQAIRSLPQVRPYLHGNDGGFALVDLGPRIEAKIEDGIRISDGQPYLALRPDDASQILGEVREAIALRLKTTEVALVARNRSTRRYARKLIELEFPFVPVLGLWELPPDRALAAFGHGDLAR